MMLIEGRGRRRLVTVLFVGMGLVVYSWALLSARSLIVNTDWRSVVPGELILNGILGAFLAIPMGLLFTLGYFVGTACLRNTWRWRAASVLPVLLGCVVLGFSIRHRLDSGVLFQDIVGVELPASARSVSHDYEGPLIEEYAEVRFVADRDEIVEMFERLRLDPDPSLPSQKFGSVPCKGDWASMSVDWSSGRVILEYLDV